MLCSHEQRDMTDLYAEQDPEAEKPEGNFTDDRTGNGTVARAAHQTGTTASGVKVAVTRYGCIQGDFFEGCEPASRGSY